MDSLERRYYRPAFRFSFPVFGLSLLRWNAGLMYDQRMNGRLKGALDFWLNIGPEFRVNGKWSLEGCVRHLCRHETLRNNPVILDINEVVGIVKFHGKGIALGLGFGGYIGKTKDFRNLAILSLILPGFPAAGFTLESDIKWVNYTEWLYEMGFSVALGEGTALFVRGTRTYRFPSAVYIGLRYDSHGPAGKPLESFRLATGAVPFDDRYKLAATGSFRMVFYRKDESRFLADVGFSSPILAGRAFFAQFRPDRFLYAARGEYERGIGRSVFVSWYAAYNLNMPVDKDLPFSGSLATGLGIKNQPDFDRLDRAFRFDVSAGWNFKYDQELTVRAGTNSVSQKGMRVGADLKLRVSGLRRSEIDLRIYADTGRETSIRPFVGLRNRPSFGGGGPAGKLRLVMGFGLFRWL